MSDIPAVYGQFGTSLGLAERTLSAILRDHLAERDTVPETWYALRLIATRGPEFSRADLTRTIERPGFESHQVELMLEKLEADGLVSGDSHLELTSAGQVEYDSLREYVSRPAMQLLSQFDVDDLTVTVRTLQAITAKAAS